jgi:hypothetical protein
MIMEKGHMKVGVLGFTFKAGTEFVMADMDEVLAHGERLVIWRWWRRVRGYSSTAAAWAGCGGPCAY